MIEKLKVSNDLHFLPVDRKRGMYIGWNRYFPSIFMINEGALQLLAHIRAKTPPNEFSPEDVALYIDAFKAYKFVYEGETDPSLDDFKTMAADLLQRPDLNAAEFYRDKKDYDQLKIVNDECNLTCSYCVNHCPQRSSQLAASLSVPKRTEEKWTVLKGIIQQYFSRKISNHVQKAELFFNGGEMLLEWDLIQRTVEFIKEKYPQIKTGFEINTNLTLLTEEKAHFLARHGFKVHVSIDGYREAHNRTRRYRTGKGSFDQVIKNVSLYRTIKEQYNEAGTGKKVLNMFQGTIDTVENFNPEEVYKMEDFGFTAARLAPNLLDTTRADARKKARLMGKFLKLNDNHHFQVTELIFTNAKEKINMKEYRFNFNCRGLSAYPRIGIEINLSTLALSHLCGFIPGASLPFHILDNDIYNPKLWEISYGFIKKRMEVFLDHCMTCELAGICAGGCILSGIDTENHINPAACSYQREMWKIYLKKAYRDSQG